MAAPVALGAAAVVAGSSPSNVANCNEDHIPSLDLGWSHHGALASFDYRVFVVVSRCTARSMHLATR